MKKFRSLVLTALGLLAFSPAAAYAETGRIVGHFDGADFELRMDAQKETSGVDFDFFQQSGSTYLEIGGMALEETGAGYEGLLFFLQFEAADGVSRELNRSGFVGDHQLK